MSHRWRAGSGGRGSVSVELAILTPLFVVLIIMAIIFGRTAIALNAIDVAAHDAARAASISRTESTAAANARGAALEALEHQGLDCIGEPQVSSDTSGFGRTDLELVFVSVTITCEVSFVDVALPGLPQTRLVSATFISPIDIFRER